MAVALPPINGKNGTKKVPAYAESSPQGPPSGRLKPLPGSSKKEREIEERRLNLRSLQKDLTKNEISVYRNSYKHTLCLEMLKEGYHLSFKELFNLIQQQLREREEAGPESLMWNMTMLQDKHEELDTLKQFLTTAESAHRKGDYPSVYMARFELACYFQRTKDKWLADHFFQTCFDTAQNIQSDNGQTQAEAHCNMGIVSEENGDFLGAVQHFEAYYELCEDNKLGWVQDEVNQGKSSPYTDACIHLYRIYTTMGHQMDKEEQHERMIDYLKRAYEKTVQANDIKLQGDAAYRLGQAYEKTGEVDTALVHLKKFYKSSKKAKRPEAMGKACDAIARAYAKMDQKDKSIEYLKEFVETAQSCGMDAELGQACHNLGNMLNCMGKYKEAGEYFTRAYNISRAMGDLESIQVNRVQCGISQAHTMLSFFSHIVVEAAWTRDYLHRTIDWKSVRAPIHESRNERMAKTMMAEPQPKEEEVKVESQTAPADTSLPEVEEDPSDQ